MLSLSNSAAADSPDVRAASRYLSELIARARTTELALEPGWLRLGHYQRGIFGGYESEADGAGFFTASNGKTDPASELEATLRGFVAEPSKASSLTKGDVATALDHPFCRFPARRLWLSEHLQINWSRLKTRACPKFETFLRETRPAAITLVFSSYYLNNPASAFGHTFLRIKKANDVGREHQDLLDYGVDYAAHVDTQNPLLYAFKGIAGLFPGTFRRLPYYYKVREYNDYESRDIWEYELELKPIELGLVVAHIWEMGSTHFDYFYLGENCSYHVLSVLEVANPNIQLLRQLGWPVLPADTVKALYKNPGLVRKIRYRPSNRTVFERRAQDLQGNERAWVLALANEPHRALPAAFSPLQQARVLDGALDLIDYRHVRQLLKDDAGESEEGLAQQALLERRAALLLVTGDDPVQPPLREMPHSGHDSARVGLGSGWSSTEGAVHSLSLRLALHDLADPPRGYPETAQIEFLPTEFWYNIEQHQLKLRELTLVRIFSLNPITAFERRLSWTVRTGLDRVRDPGCRDCLTAAGELGVGYTVSLWERALLVWLMPEVEVRGPVKTGLASAVRLAAGGIGGVRFRLHDNLIGLVSGKWHALPAQTPHSVGSGAASLRWHYSQNFALDVAGDLGAEHRTLMARSLIYF